MKRMTHPLARTATTARSTVLAVAAALLLVRSASPATAAPRDPSSGLAGVDPTATGASIVLRGTILTPDGPLQHGYVGIQNGRIVSVSDKEPDIPGAIRLNTTGVVLPGLVDVHNHVSWNALPRWHPGRTFTHRDQWAVDAEYRRLVAGPYARASAKAFCDMNTWGELRALIGGVTSIMATHRTRCIRGLVRNLDFNSGFYGTTPLDLEHIVNVPLLPPASNPAARAAFVDSARTFIANPFYEALSIHVAEGTDAVAEEQFRFMEAQLLLNPKGVLIHGISLVRRDFQEMAARGTALIWSPRSNLELYGATADVNAALDAGVEIALAPDWAVTGGGNMLDELKTAAQWNHEHLGGRLTNRRLVEMTTSIPAHIVGIDDEVGAIRAGLRADLLVVGGEDDDPYGTVVRAETGDVRLVLIGGVPVYGDPALMASFWGSGALEKVVLPGGQKVLATPAAGIVVSDIAARLGRVLRAAGTTLAPLAER